MGSSKRKVNIYFPPSVLFLGLINSLSPEVISPEQEKKFRPKNVTYVPHNNSQVGLLAALGSNLDLEKVAQKIELPLSQYRYSHKNWRPPPWLFERAEKLKDLISDFLLPVYFPVEGEIRGLH